MESSKSHSIASLAELVPGAEVAGDPGHRVLRLVHPAEVSGPGDLTLIMSPEALALGNGGGCAVIDRKLVADASELTRSFKSCLIVERPRYALARLSQCFPRRLRPDTGVHPTAVIESNAIISENCSIGANTCIESGARVGRGTWIHSNASVAETAIVGEDCILYPGVYIGDHVKIGDRVIIHPNAVIGGDGFAFDTPSTNTTETARRAEIKTGGRNDPFERIESMGSVHIQDDVEIGAGTTIDRATLGTTIVGEGTKIDNLVQIGHGCVIGKRVLICSQVGLAGSCQVGDGAVLAGKVGVADHRRIGEDSVLMAKSGVTRDIPAGEVWYGMPARPVKETLRAYALIDRLGDMRKQIAEMEQQIDELSGPTASA